MATGHNSDQEQRNYFRLQETISLEYRLASPEEVQKAAQAKKGGDGGKLDVTYQLEAINRQLMPLLATVRAESPAIAQYLEGLNQKIDIVAGMVFFRNASLDDSAVDAGEYVRARTVDISEGGISFDDTNPPEVDSFIYCRLAISGFQLGLQTYGKVVHLGESAQGADLTRVRVSFPLISDYERKQLTRYIFDRQREQIRKSMDDQD